MFAYNRLTGHIVELTSSSQIHLYPNYEIFNERELYFYASRAHITAWETLLMV